MQNLIEICTLLVDDLYGELSSQVFSILMHLGRASFPALRSETRLPLRSLRNALAVLVQQHLCLWYKDETGVINYEADWHQAYALIQSGKIIRITEERCGGAASLLVSHLLQLGHCKVGDLISAYTALIEKTANTSKAQENRINSTRLTNGAVNSEHTQSLNQNDHTSGSIQSVNQLHAALNKLLHKGYIVPVQLYHFKPEADIHKEALADALDDEDFSEGIRGTKLKLKYDRAVARRERDWRDDSIRIQPVQAKSASLKRKRNVKDTANKRQKSDRHLTNGINGINGNVNGYEDVEDEHTTTIDEDVVVRVNYEKFNVVFRNEQLTGLCERFLGRTVANVYEAFLQLMEKRVPRCHDLLLEALKETPLDEEGDECDDDDFVDPSVTSYEVAAVLNSNIDLKAGLGYVSGSHESDEGQGHEQIAVNGGLDDDDDVHIPRTSKVFIKTEPETEHQQLVRQYMGVLREDPRHFVRWHTSKDGGEWCIDYLPLTKYLIQIQIENTVNTRFGREATRVIRLLHSKGKLDEKQIAKLGLLREKNVRNILTHLQEAGLLEIQEVPKDTARQPNRTIFLWFYDQDRCRRLILHDTYQAMARMLQRAKFEKGRIKDVLEKAERTDVKGKEDRFLSEDERRALRRWLEVEDILMSHLGRQDDLVALLRDFTPVEAI